AGEDLRDAVAHQTAAEDCDALRHSLARRVAAVGVKDVAGVEVRSLGRQEQQRPCEIGWLAETTLWHAREEARARRLRSLVVPEHPGRQRRAENGRRDRIDRDSGSPPFAT